MNVSVGLYEKAMPCRLSLEKKLKLAKGCGFSYMELSIDESDQKLSRLDDSDFAMEACEAMRTTGLPISTMCLSGHRRYPLGGDDSRCLEIMEGALELSLKLGVRLIQLAGYDVYYEPSTERTAARFCENLRKCVDMAARRGVVLGFETMETPFMNTVEKAMKYVDLINSPYLQVYPDIGNICNATEDYLGDIRLGRGHIAAVHLKETAPSVFRDLEYGQGRVDFAGCCAELLKQCVGMFTCEFWYDGKTEPYEYIMRNKRYVEKVFSGNR